MKKVQVDSIPNQLLHIQNGYKIAAATWVIQCIMQNIAEYTSHYNNSEREQVTKEIDRIVERIQVKRRKDAGNG